jgi:dihydropteroate synthase
MDIVRMFDVLPMQSKIFSPNKTLNVRGKLVDLTIPKVMGVINVTPDSFYKGSRVDEKTVLAKVEGMIADGATFIDVGGYSSRPGADDISTEEELNRVLPVVKAIQKTFPDAIMVIDTFRSEVARQTIDAGVSLVNDISSGKLDKDMMAVIGRSGVPYIMMHMKGTPQTMSQLAQYDNLIKEVIEYFHQQMALANEAGIKDIIIDPGFGFAKTMEQNFELLKQLGHLRILEKPLLVGLSRKSMIWRTLGSTPDNALNGTTTLNTLALIRGASILRVHDVKEAVECVRLVEEVEAVGNRREEKNRK